MSVSVKLIIGVVTASIITGIILTFFLGNFLGNLGTVQPEIYRSEDGIYQDSQAVSNFNNRDRPIIKARNGSIYTGQMVNIKDFLDSITDADGEDLISRVQINGDREGLKEDYSFYSDIPGVYRFNYSVTDHLGVKAEEKITILVNNPKKKEVK